MTTSKKTVLCVQQEPNEDSANQPIERHAYGTAEFCELLAEIVDATGEDMGKIFDDLEGSAADNPIDFCGRRIWAE